MFINRISKADRQTWYRGMPVVLMVAVTLLVYLSAVPLDPTYLPAGASTPLDGESGDGTALEALKLTRLDFRTYAFKTLAGDVIEIASPKDSPSQPYLKLNRGGEGASLQISFPAQAQAVFSQSENRLNWASDKSEVVFYPVAPSETETGGHKFTQNELGGVEFDVILAEKPPTNKIDFDIETRGLKFYYQPALTEQEKALGFLRPENVVGSYAVYYESNNQSITGKAFHIYRPRVYDAEGKEIWGELNIDEAAGTLSLTVDQEWLDRATYPVTIDPTFGYTTIGGSSAPGQGANEKTGSKFTLSENGRGQSLTFYLKTSGGATAPFVAKGTIYADSSGAPGALLATTAEITISSTAQWWTASFASPVSLTAGTYWLVVHHATKVNIYYDTGATNQSANNADTYSDGPSNPFGTPSYSNKVYSIYATYISWESYNDPARTVRDDSFTAGENTVYMYGLGFQASHNYAVGYYDGSATGGGQKVATDSGLLSGASGDLSSQYLLTTDMSAQAGTWHAVVFDSDLGVPPQNYNDAPGQLGYVTEDSFDVAAEAIPEFPTVIAAIAVAASCFGLYYWMKKRRLGYVPA